jgi:hypothetical protein
MLIVPDTSGNVVERIDRVSRQLLHVNHNTAVRIGSHV